MFYSWYSTVITGRWRQAKPVDWDLPPNENKPNPNYNEWRGDDMYEKVPYTILTW